MSTWFEETVSCPTCGAAITARLARGVHAARAPEVREQVFSRTFHRVECTACGTAFTAGRTFVYTDMDRKHWVHVAPWIQRPRWPELEDATDKLFERAMTGSPLTHVLREGFKLRLVFGLEELREKLVIWEANLEDACVECAKVHAIREQPALIKARTIVVDVVRDGALELVVDDDRRIVVAREIVEELAYDDRLPSRFPELFGGRFVSIFRLTGPRYRWAEPG